MRPLHGTIAFNLFTCLQEAISNWFPFLSNLSTEYSIYTKSFIPHIDREVWLFIHIL